MAKKLILLSSIFLILFALISYYSPNYDIAKVKKTINVQKINKIDNMKNKDTVYKQRIIAKLTTGKHKGKLVTMTNRYSESGLFDDKITPHSKIYVKVKKNTSNHELMGSLKGIKRDSKLLVLVFLFLFALIFVSGKEGLRSLYALATNIVIIIAAVQLYLNTNIKEIGFISVFLVTILFCVITFLIILRGFHRETFYLIAITLAALIATIIVVWLAMHLTNQKGIYYEALEYVTLPPRELFFIEIIIGALGAVVDIVITIFTSMQEWYKQNPQTTEKSLRKSGFEVGKDIMGTMTNILLFVYLVGSIPMILLLLRNGLEVSYSFRFNLSLELIRAITGGIAITIAIPLTIYISTVIIYKGEDHK